MGLIIPSKPLGAAAVKTSGLSTQFSSQGQQTSQFNVSPADRNVLDWVRAFNSSSGMNEFTGQPADLIGFVYRDIRFDGKPQFMIARFAISCCVADASALGVIVQTADAAKLTQDSWVHVKGKFVVQSVDQHDTPVLIAESVSKQLNPPIPIYIRRVYRLAEHFETRPDRPDSRNNSAARHTRYSHRLAVVRLTCCTPDHALFRPAAAFQRWAAQ